MSRVHNMLAIALLGFSTAANAALIKSYDFNGDLTDTLGNGVDLVASGASVADGRYHFLENQGLRLSSALPSTTAYAVEIKLQANGNLNGYQKLIDFQDLATDHGLYLLNGAVRFYTASPSVGLVALDTDFTVGLARTDTGEMALFLNGSPLWSGADLGQAVSAQNILNFFEDDVATGKRETLVGSVDWIRIHHDSSTFGTAPVPLPAPLALLAVSLLGLGFRRTVQRQSV